MSEAAKFDSHRRLCPDGGCIGVIGDDGRCRVCGRSASGAAGSGKDEPAPAGFVPPDLDDDDEDEDEDEDEGEDKSAGAEARGAAAAPTAGGFDPNRRLCPDGECLGVIGADGVCNVCGKKAD
jgi:hypothetical protein